MTASPLTWGRGFLLWEEEWDGETCAEKIRLEGWNYSGAATYFLTLCTKGRKPLLSRVVGCGILDAPQLQLSEYGTCVQEALMYLENQQKNMQFHISVIMPNHVHILLTLCETVGASHGASRMPRPTNQVIPMFVSSLKRFTNRKTGVDLWQKATMTISSATSRIFAGLAIYR